MVTITVNNDIILRTYKPEDADGLFTAINASRRHLGIWLDWIKHTTRTEHSMQYIKDSLHQANMQEALYLGIFYDGILVGGVNMYQWDREVKKALIGYWIVKEQEGKGVISICLQYFTRFLFEKTGLNKIEIHFSVANKRSAKVAERLGCKIEGIIRQSALRNGVREDVVVCGLLKSEWEGRVV